MSRTFAIARRELLAYLCSPAGYIVTALFLAFSAVLYFFLGALTGEGFSQGEPATLRLFFAAGSWVFLIIAPAISMRAISEELRLGTFESLMTSPVTETQVVLGKFAGALGFLILMLVPTALYVIALELHGRPDYGELASGYLGLVLAGAALIASGIVASSLTSSQVVAYLTTFFFWLIVFIAMYGFPFLGWALAEMSTAGEPSAIRDWLIDSCNAISRVLQPANPHTRQREFVDGLIDSFNILYFLSLTAFFLAAAVKSLEVRRWR